MQRYSIVVEDAVVAGDGPLQVGIEGKADRADSSLFYRRMAPGEVRSDIVLKNL